MISNTPNVSVAAGVWTGGGHVAATMRMREAVVDEAATLWTTAMPDRHLRCSINNVFITYVERGDDA